jgi:hypothetical protein
MSITPMPPSQQPGDDQNMGQISVKTSAPNGSDLGDIQQHSLMQRKRRLATSALWPMGDTEADAGDLQRMVADGVTSSGGDAVMSAMTAMFQRDDIPVPALRDDGSLPFD